MRHVSEPVDLHGLTVTEIAEAGRREGYRIVLAKLDELAHARRDPLDVLAQFDAWLRQQVDTES